MKNQVMQAIGQFAKQTITPTFIIHDDTISKNQAFVTGVTSN